MIFSKSVMFFLTVLLVLSVLIANLMNLIATDHNFYTENPITENFTTYLSGKYGRIRDTPNNLIWFLQVSTLLVLSSLMNFGIRFGYYMIIDRRRSKIDDHRKRKWSMWTSLRNYCIPEISDIHISIFRDPGRITQFQQFCDTTVKNIKPSVVLATGDLTDAKAKDNLGSSQVKYEWVYYYNIIKESGVGENTIWLDIRGNHDNFNIRTLNSEENYFRNYSVQGSKNPRSYVHFLNKNGINVAFLGIDACPEPGLRRPFNFIGILDAQEQQNIQKLKIEAESKADHIVWFGHYPTSCILCLERESQRLDVRKLIGSTLASQAYFCGHLHSMGGLVPRMYTKHKYGFLELELSDWKDNRMFRVAAIDHGLFSFTDQKHNSWPIILVTNPKHAQYEMPGHEPLSLIPDSSHIRILVFSDVKVETVKISFDKESWMECKVAESPLYVCKWLPELFKRGVHYLNVIAIDEVGKQTAIEHPFSLDGSSIRFEVTPRILLMTDAGAVFQAVFSVLLILNILPLVILRFQKRPPKYRRKTTRQILRRVWLLSKIDRIFYPIVLYAVYIPLGPWAIGELIDGYIGVIFAWGILIKEAFIPEPFTYMYGGVQLMFVQIPLIFVLAHSIENRLCAQYATGLRLLIKHLPFISLLSIQLLLAYFFWLEYGTMALLFGPLRTWSIALSTILWYKTLTLPMEYCRHLKKLYEIQS